MTLQEAARVAPLTRGTQRVRLLAFTLAMASCGWSGVGAAEEAASAGGAALRAFSDEEVEQYWAGRPARSTAHRGYIYIDEEDIVEGTELPLFTIEAARVGRRRGLERIADGDPGLSARIADLAPELARETERERRANDAFYSRRSAAARRDTPETTDLVGPAVGLIMQAVRNR